MLTFKRNAAGFMSSRQLAWFNSETRGYCGKIWQYAYKSRLKKRFFGYSCLFFRRLWLEIPAFNEELQTQSMDHLAIASKPQRQNLNLRQERYQNYSRWLINSRTKAGITQKQLAKAAGMVNTQISRYERGANLPSRETVLQIANALDADPAEALQAAGYEPKATFLHRPPSSVTSGMEIPAPRTRKDSELHAFTAAIPHQPVQSLAPLQIAVANDLATRADLLRVQVGLEEKILELRDLLSRIIEVLPSGDSADTAQPSSDPDATKPLYTALNATKLIAIKSKHTASSKIETLSEFQHDLDQAFEVARERCTSLSLMLIDVDNLKVYNQECGHHMGDNVLRIVAHLLRETARPQDTVARLLQERAFDWGDRYGDQYALLMPGTNADQARQVSDEYLRKVDGYDWECKKVTVSVSVVTRTARMIQGRDLLQKAVDQLDDKRAHRSHTGA